MELWLNFLYNKIAFIAETARSKSDKNLPYVVQRVLFWHWLIYYDHDDMFLDIQKWLYIDWGLILRW